MPTEDGLDPISGHADEHEQRGTSRILKATILVVAVTVSGTAIALSLGIPAKVFADATASLPDTSAPQPSANQAAPTIQSTADAQAIASIAGAQASASTASEPPTRNEIVAAPEPVNQAQTENNDPSSGVLLRQFQAWAAKEDAQVEDARAQVEPVQPVQDAPAKVVDNAAVPVRPAHKHRRARSVENAQTEIRHIHKTKVRRHQYARVEARPVQDAQAQDQPVQNAQAPSFPQSFGWRQ
jgi:hypothetical protein